MKEVAEKAVALEAFFKKSRRVNAPWFNSLLMGFDFFKSFFI
jgi:hypothetical protein